MGNVVNLRTAKKQKARAEKRAKTDSKTASVSGVSKADRSLINAKNKLQADRLSGHKRESRDET